MCFIVARRSVVAASHEVRQFRELNNDGETPTGSGRRFVLLLRVQEGGRKKQTEEREGAETKNRRRCPRSSPLAHLVSLTHHRSDGKVPSSRVGVPSLPIATARAKCGNGTSDGFGFWVSL
uniref:Uncharacterized protein n=1 Tax=Neobodo designis TaxID=312471 RepID=A0A7S1QEC2_NEODS